MPRFTREMTLINSDTSDLLKKKVFVQSIIILFFKTNIWLYFQEELLSRLTKKLSILSQEQTNVAEESQANDLLGTTIVVKLGNKLKPSDASKLRTYIDDVGHITMLLLSLSSRLAKIENILQNTTNFSTENVSIIVGNILNQD